MVTGQASSEPSSQAHMPPMTVLLTDLLYFLPESEGMDTCQKWDREGVVGLGLSRCSLGVHLSMVMGKGDT